MMGNRLSAFLAEHERRPTPEKEQQIRQQEREDRRQADGLRRESELRRAFLTTPGATPEQWEKEKPGILAQDRADQAIKNKAAASQAQSGLYRRF